VHHVETEAEVAPDWFESAGTVGLTAGTSTPDDVIDRVEQRIREMAVCLTAAGSGV
jgi:4-hydroxy-3-methylbut-2-enyl diphosphate reductase